MQFATRVLSLLLLAGALSGCLNAAPYPVFFEPTDAGHIADRCDQARKAPGDSAKVQSCLDARGAAWEKKGLEIRRYSRLSGGLAIPATAVSIGLAAQGDPNHAVAPLGLLTGSALNYGGAYARPDQATVYEQARDAYQCLSSATADWRTYGIDGVGEARDALHRSVASLEAEVDTADAEVLIWSAKLAALPAGSAVAEAFAAVREVKEARRWRDEAWTIDAEAEAAVARAGGQPGVRLLKRADEIDAAASRAISARTPDPRVVASAAAANLPGSIGQVPQTMSPTPAADGTEKASPPPPPPGMMESAGCDQACRQQARDIANAARARLARMRLEATAVEKAAARFNATLAAYKPTQTDFGAQCVLSIEDLLPLSASPTTVELDDDKGWFLVKGGVPPYGVRASSGLTATVTPVSALVAHVDLQAAAGNAWSVQVMDAAGGEATVQVTQPEEPAGGADP
ncbi:MAG TPA: hypothetical protein VF138_10005 [Caulobacteraceae bacterium]